MVYKMRTESGGVGKAGSLQGVPTHSHPPTTSLVSSRLLVSPDTLSC